MMTRYIPILVCLLLMAACKKDDDTTAPIDQLPLITQTGANTFGCLVNGEAFIDTSGNFNCFYQFVDGEYYFGIHGDTDDLDPFALAIGTVKKEVFENESYELVERIDGNAWGGGVFHLGHVNGESSYTNSLFTGGLTITKFDFDTHIVSGTFWFDLEHPITGERVEIREGRFDTIFLE